MEILKLAFELSWCHHGLIPRNTFLYSIILETVTNYELTYEYDDKECDHERKEPSYSQEISNGDPICQPTSFNSF